MLLWLIRCYCREHCLWDCTRPNATCLFGNRINPQWFSRLISFCQACRQILVKSAEYCPHIGLQMDCCCSLKSPVKDVFIICFLSAQNMASLFFLFSWFPSTSASLCPLFCLIGAPLVLESIFKIQAHCLHWPPWQYLLQRSAKSFSFSLNSDACVRMCV